MSDEAQEPAAEAPAEAPAEQAYAEYPAEVAPAMEEAPPPRGIKGLLARRFFKIPVVAIIGIVVLLLIGAAVGSSGVLNKKVATPPMKMVSLSGGYDLQGPQVKAASTMEFPIQFNSSDNSSTVTNVYEVSAACSWTDDYAGSEPDSMTFELVNPEKQNISKETVGSSGAAQLTLEDKNVTDKRMVDNTAGWVLRVTCNYAGHKDAGPFGFLIHPDAGNNFDAKISYKYYGHETTKTTKK
jgi:hypothetical protein